MSEDIKSWPDCHEVQCAQAHELAKQVLLVLGEQCPEDVYIIGKMIRIMQAIDKLKSDQVAKPITSEDFVKYWDNLDFQQHCLLSAQSLLRAASIVKHQS